ncbi:MAG: hypothetical protein PHN88_03120 [Ignavibacteria bacterium]|nr:hypothetical protein [Ignavibacteria bacterium]
MNILIPGFRLVILKSILTLFVTLICFRSTYCQNDSAIISYEPGKYISKLLHEKKKIIIGDSYHHHPFYFYTVIDVLNGWFSDAVNEKSGKNKLTLILEHGDDFATAMNNAVSISDLNAIIDDIFADTYQEDLEFYSKLIEFKQKVHQYNSNNNANISFKVKGFEMNSFFRNIPDSIMEKTNEETDLWFINTRDSVVSSNIIEYINENADEDILMFYGNAHIIKTRINKSSITNNIKDDRGFGYYDAYYLKKYYGDEQFLTFAQIDITSRVEKFIDTSKINCDIIFKFPSNIPNMLAVYGVDYAIRKNHIAKTPPHPLGLVFSRRNILNILDVIRWLKKYDTDWSKEKISFFNRYLDILTDITYYDSIKIVINEEYLSNYNGFERIESDQFKSRINDIIFKKHKTDKNYKKMLTQMGFDPMVLDISGISDTSLWINSIWPEEIKHVKYINSAGTLWLGDDPEKKYARQYLSEFTGYDYPEIYKYLVWWRKNINRLEY